MQNPPASSVPVRTRSVRKPAVGSSSQVSTASADRGASQDQVGSRPQGRRGNTSPSRLPSTSSGLPRKPSVSQGGAASSNGLARPPPRRATIGRPPLTADNVRPASYRSGARTPTEASSSSTSIQRAPGKRQSRTASTSTLPNNLTATGPPLASYEPRPTSKILSSASTVLPPPSSHALSTASSQPRQAQPQLTSQIPPLNPPEATVQQHHQILQSRPTFSTLQQHFSPLKSLGPKPATASFLAPPSPSKLPSNIQISAETARLQAELLQLHILHRTAPRISAEYRASAKRSLRTRFEDVAARQRELVAAEAREEVRLNGLALKAWTGGGGGLGLEEKVQRLDEALTGIWRLGEAGGRYTRLVRRFEEWHGTAQEILGSREGRVGNALGGVDLDCTFVTPLEVSWREEREHLARKLDRWREQLRDLDAQPGAERGVAGGDDTFADTGYDGSTGGRAGGTAGSLVLAVRGMRLLVQGMLAELDIMARLEREMVRRDEEWVRTAVDAASDDDADDGGAGGDGVKDHPTPGAIWRVY